MKIRLRHLMSLKYNGDFFRQKEGKTVQMSNKMI